MSELIGKMRQLRTPNLLYLGKGQILASLDLGYQLVVDAHSSKSLCRALQPCPMDLALTAIYSLILRDCQAPTSVLIGADDLVHTMNLLFINKGATLHVVDARALVHEKIKVALDRNEGHYANLISHISALGEENKEIEFTHFTSVRDCIICLDEEGGIAPDGSRDQILQSKGMVSTTLENLLTWEKVMGLQLLLINAPKHLPQILSGIESIWSLNPFAHVILKTGMSLKGVFWKELSAHLSSTGRRAWSLPNPRPIGESSPQSGAIWITPSGI